MNIDFHVHSKYSSDCFMEPERILIVAKGRGVGAVAICDHNSFECHNRKIRSNSVILIPAEEISTNDGHLIGLFLNEHVASGDFFDVVDSINSQDGVIVLAHPFRKRGGIEELKGYIDVVETFNARTSDECNKKAANFAKKNKMPAMAGSDAHFYFEIGNGTTVLEANNDEDIRRMILKGGKLLCKHSPFFVNPLTNLNALLKIVSGL